MASTDPGRSGPDAMPDESAPVRLTWTAGDGTSHSADVGQARFVTVTDEAENERRYGSWLTFHEFMRKRARTRFTRPLPKRPASPALWCSARSNLGCRTSSGARKTRSASSTSPSRGGDPPEPGDDPPDPPGLPSEVEPARDVALRADIGAMTLRLMRRLDRLQEHVNSVEQRTEQARSIALDALDMADPR